MAKNTKKIEGEQKDGGETPNEEKIRVAAYYRWLERLKAGVSGGELDDWMEAEDKWRDNIVPTRND
jgi:hypothetical protein